MRQSRLLFFWVLAAAQLCTAAGAAPLFPNQIVVRAQHMGWGSQSTNLTLVLSNGAFSSGAYRVSPEVISNLMAIAQRPWPKAPTNTWPPIIIDPINLGLTAEWVKANHERLLQSYSGESEKGVFPNASARQRAWLTNALADLEMLGEAVRGCYGSQWTDDYPSLELLFERDDGKTVQQLLRLSTTAQQPFMIPWHVSHGTNESASANADISRAVVQVLPPGFLHRDRLSGDLLQMIAGEFPSLNRVQEFMKKAALEETLGQETGRLLQCFEFRSCRVPAGSYHRFPDKFMCTLHRTNWPERLVMPIQTGIERGVVTNLKSILDGAESRVAPLFKQEWLISRLSRSNHVTVGVEAEHSPDHQWLRGHMDKVGRASFYDRIQPALRRSVGFVLREGPQRSSEWAMLEDGRLLLYGFTGDGVLDWQPGQLGFRGDSRLLRSYSINFVGVFVAPDGTLTEVVQPERH